MEAVGVVSKNQITFIRQTYCMILGSSIVNTFLLSSSKQENFLELSSDRLLINSTLSSKLLSIG